MEIERKFDISRLLVSNIPINDIGQAIEQGYVISKKDVEMRIRRIDGRCFITVKSDGTLSRKEWEQEIPEWVYQSLCVKVIGNFVKKMRHSIYYGKLKIEIDIFVGNLHGLVLMECEFTNEETAKTFVLPPWAQGAIDVTDDKRFKNKNLALHPEAIKS